jgi:hypothetical protein
MAVTGLSSDHQVEGSVVNFRVARHPGSMHQPAFILCALCDSCVKLRCEIEGRFMATEKLELSLQRCADR